jgi:hypothetical protein
VSPIARNLRNTGQSVAGFFVPIFQLATSRVRAFCVSNQGIKMTDQLDLADEDEEEFEDDVYHEDDVDILGEDEWEDHPEAKKLYKAMPKGWIMVKVVNWNIRSMAEMEKWLVDNCRDKFKKVGFSSGCAYNVAVQFADVVDATMFKLRWR